MRQPEEATTPCPVCGTPIFIQDGKIPKHGRRMGVGVMPCEASAPGVGFARQWAKEKKRGSKEQGGF